MAAAQSDQNLVLLMISNQIQLFVHNELDCIVLQLSEQNVFLESLLQELRERYWTHGEEG